MSSQDLGAVLEKFGSFTAKPAKFLSAQTDAKDEYKNLVKSLYDLTKASESKDKKSTSSALPELMVEEFDEEQVWQQIELQNSECWDKLVWEVANCMSIKDGLNFPVTFGDDGKDEQEIKEDAEDSSESENEENESKQITEKPKTKPKKSSVVDDEFFKLQDMEKFLIQEEKHGGQLVAAESDEDSIDMFDDIDDYASDQEGGDSMKYADFFENYDGNDGMKEPKKSKKSDKKVKFADEDISGDDGDETMDVKKKKDKKVKFADEEMNESDEDDDGIEGDEDYEGDDDEIEQDKDEPRKMKPKLDQPSDESDDESIVSEVDIKETAPRKDEKQSEFEQRQQRLKTTITRLEEKHLSEAPWQLKGEVDASKRPQNSLLQEVLDFDLTTRPPPIITEQTTVTLEDIIRRRIKDKAWDDVIKKEKPVDDALAFRKTEVLDHAKSKLSLAQVYEAEYLKQKGGDDAEEKEPESHTQIREAMSKLFAQLDALSHYHYTPKAAQPEVKIVTNTPAISMEEVAPVAASSASLLAPEEVKKKKPGDLLSKDERTDTDKKRERRKKKQFQKSKGGVSKVTDHRNTKKAAETDKSDKSLKTSKAFFQQLNDDSSSILKNSNKRKNVKNKGN